MVVFIADGRAWDYDTTVALCDGCYDMYNQMYRNYIVGDDEPFNPVDCINELSEDPA